MDVGYWSRYGMGAAAAGVAILGGMSTFWATKPDLPARPEPTAVASENLDPSPLIDHSALSATLPAPPSDPRPAKTRPAPSAPIPEEEPAATLEEIELPEVPLEGLAVIERRRDQPAAITRGGAPGLLHAPSLQTVDPFSKP